MNIHYNASIAAALLMNIHTRNCVVNKRALLACGGRYDPEPYVKYLRSH